MANKSSAALNIDAAAYAANGTYAALFSTVPTTSAGTEISGGSPAYARKAITWSAPSNGLITASVTFDVPNGASIAGGGVYTASTGGTYLQGGAVATQAYSSQGTYVLNLSYQAQ